MPIPLIDPADHAAIQGLGPGAIAFPDIDYQYFYPLNRPRTTLLAAHTNARNNVPAPLLAGVPWNNNGNIAWQNQQLEKISNHIYKWIDDYQTNITLTPNQKNALLDKIFVWIQIWGGGEGRGVFVRGGGWHANYNRASYQLGINNIIAPVPNYIQAFTDLDNIAYLGISFITKHIYFWSKAKAPIFDNIVSRAVFGVRQANVAAYPTYLGALNQLTEELPYPTDAKTIERNLFSFLDTPDGQTWLELR
jgi:hypothetical protein